MDIATIIADLKNDAVGDTPIRSIPEVHYVSRNLRVVVVKLRHNLGLVNEEIKVLSKMREGLSQSIDQLSKELRGSKQAVTIKRPRFIKQRTSMVDGNWWGRSDMVVMERKQIQHALKCLQNEFQLNRHQLQDLSDVRKIVTLTIDHRTRVLSLIPELIAAMIKHRDRATAAAKKQLTDPPSRAGFKPSAPLKQSKCDVCPPRLPVFGKKNAYATKQSGDSRGKKGKCQCRLKRVKSAVPTASRSLGHLRIPSGKDHGVRRTKSSTNHPVSIDSDEETRYNRKVVINEAWVDDEALDVERFGKEFLPTEFVFDYDEVAKTASQACKKSEVLRKKSRQVVEKCFLVPTPGVDLLAKGKQPAMEHGRYYGVACNGRCPRKKVSEINTLDQHFTIRNQR